MKKKITILIVLLTLGASFFPANALSISPGPQSAGTPGLPILFGAYTSLDLQSSIGELTGMNNWLTSHGASGVTFAGDFLSITFNPAWNVGHELDAAWNNGFVPFVNLMPSASWEGLYFKSNCDTTSEIASGSCDAHLQSFAGYYKAWVNKGGGRRAFIAPLPEMNGNWITYATNGPTYIQAFIRIRQIFENQGVPRSAVRWVFAPNGWHDPANPWQAFENYYPGNEYADIVAFSAYNYGGCPANTPWRIWDAFETAIEPYLIRMRSLAPSKPIFIAQTGTVGIPDDSSNPNQTKSNWISDTFDKLADYPAVRGILYFNMVKTESSLVNCPNGADYRIYYSGSNGDAGFLNIMKDSRFGKWSTGSSNWSNIAFTDVSYTFADVQPSHPFSGVANIWYYDAVHSLYNSGITGGCATAPLRYCPEGTVTRAQMAIFLEKGMRSSSYFPPPATGTKFADVPSGYWSAAWIEQLAKDGITGGCGGSNYCPDTSVTRAQMAIFLLRAKHGSGYTPPSATGTMFNDVPGGYWAANWIERLAVEGITGGCGGGNYCPDQAVTRAQMAIFLRQTFGLP